MKKSLLISLYRDIQRIRMVELKISEKYKEGLMRCPVHLSVGQEAVAVGVCKSLNKNDQVLSAHRSHAHYLAKGGDLKSMLAELYGKKTGCAGGKGGSMHLIDLNKNFLGAVPIVGSTIPIAVGVSWGKQLQNKKTVTVSFFGDGATEEGVFAESLNFSNLVATRTLFVCEDNLFSVYSSKKHRRSKKFSLKSFVESHGIKYFSGNGNNIFDVLSITKSALNYIRKFNLPAFINFNTYRWLEHCGPNWDTQLGYRKKNELLKWIKKCPVVFLENYVLKKNILNYKKIEKIKKNIDNEIKSAFIFSEKSPFPRKKDLLSEVYKK